MKTKCPYCNYLATDHETLEGIKNPKEGDISFCISCSGVSKFKNKKLKKVTLESLDKKELQEVNEIKIAWQRIIT